jgi:surfeit locus 1 family protein
VRAPAAPKTHRQGWIGPAIATVLLFGVLVALGSWQLERKAWKEGLIDSLDRRLAAAPVDLPPAASWPQLDQAADEFRRVKVRAAFLPGQEALVYTSGSALRSDVSGPGYWVFAPARVPDGSVVVVNRGFVPEGRQDPATRPGGQPSEPIEVIGVLRWPEAGSWLTPRPDLAKSLWFQRDAQAIATAKGWNAAEPFFVDQEAPVPPGGLPAPGSLRANLRNEHLQYALTWYGLAGVLVVMFGVWLFRRSRGTE